MSFSEGSADAISCAFIPEKIMHGSRMRYFFMILYFNIGVIEVRAKNGQKINKE
ncbi:hypothetical protein GCM10022217_02270 [Chryseobacterium ginsenosidimutans]